jgi:hypothetical protein
MRKTLMLGAVALLASYGAASAVTTITVPGFCNEFHIRKSNDGYAVKDAACTSSIGGGYLTTIKGEGKTVVFGIYNPAVTPPTQLVMKFSYPFVTGGTYTLEFTQDGVSLIETSSGNYTVGTGAPGDRGTKSLIPAR